MHAALAILLPLALAVNAPPCSSDLLQFPPLFVCERELADGTRYLHFLEARAALYPCHVWEFRVAVAAVQLRLDAWRELQWAWQAAPNDKPAALARLRDTLGWQRYYEGLLP